MITCDDIEGRCCNSCHEDAVEGYYGGEMCMLYRGERVFAHVCCAKYDAANELMELDPHDDTEDASL